MGCILGTSKTFYELSMKVKAYKLKRVLLLLKAIVSP
jgi:hypothetical protein